MDITASAWMSILQISGLLFYLIPIILVIFAVIKFYKLAKEKNRILNEISNKLDRLSNK
ncbi:MAG TPA: hypothetical protein VNR61_02655 [Niallia sp.]|nr:hypothetical protein [Niallia sp.]